MKTTEDTALAVTTTESTELAVSSAQEMARAEIESSITIARKFPRDESQAFARLMKSCKRPSFAKGVEYSYPRGGKQIHGPSVKVAREAARLWGNLRHGLEIVRDDEDSRQIRGYAWDVETNVKVSAEHEFRKLIFRKKDGWIKPDERDLRELTNKHGAILQRNCLLQILPPDLIEDAVNESLMTMRDDDAKDPEGARKRLIMAFESLNISPKMLSKYLGHPVDELQPEGVEELRGIFASIKDGNSKWADYTKGNGETEKGKLDPDKLEGTERAPIGEKIDLKIEVAMKDAGKFDAEGKAEATKRLLRMGVLAAGKKWYDCSAPWDKVQKALGDLLEVKK